MTILRLPEFSLFICRSFREESHHVFEHITEVFMSWSIYAIRYISARYMYIRLSTAFLTKYMAKVILSNIFKKVVYIQVVISTTKLERVICSWLHQNWERICKDKVCRKAL